MAALGHTQGLVAPHRGGYAQARPTCNTNPMPEVMVNSHTILPTLEAMPLVEAIPLAKQALSRALLLHIYTHGANSKPVVSCEASDNRVAGSLVVMVSAVLSARSWDTVCSKVRR